MKKTMQILLAGSLLMTACHAQVSNEPAYLKSVDPTIGSVGALLEPTRPTVQLPNQMIRFTPQRKDFLDDQISSFPLNVVSHRLGQVFAIKPSTFPVTPERWRARQTWDHELEVNRPWYYSTYLIDEEIKVEFTAGKKTGIFLFTFPEGKTKSLLLDVYNQGPSSWEFLLGNRIRGMETWQGDVKVYMYGAFSEAPVPVQQQSPRAAATFPSASRSLEFKYAISYVSPGQAQRNFEAEAAKTSFTELADNGRKAWDRVIGQIRVEGGTPAQQRSFYSALYRCYERMTDVTEDGQYYSGYSKRVEKADRPFYVDDWSWDTYLAHHPLRIILDPKGEEDMLQSYVKMYEQSGWMPTFPVLFGDHACMNGFHSTIVFLDAWRKGLRNYDIEQAYAGMRKNAVSATMLPWRNGEKTVLDDFYHEKGYFPSIAPGEKEPVEKVHSFEKRQAVAVTLGNAYDDWALAQLAGDLGKISDTAIFAPRGRNFHHLWHPEKKMFLPKDDQGNWIPIDPKFDGGMGGRDYYDENNGWTYMWQVQQDIPALIALNGGQAAFEARLDQLFREGLDRSKYEFWSKFPDATGLVGQFSMGNEPSFHIPFLYNFTASPWKTQKRTRFLLDTWFTDNIFGIPGDEDGGGMSAFVVFASMGFYPVTPGIPEYTITSPVFSSVAIHLQNGKTFRVSAPKNSTVNKYIQSARFNGKPMNKLSFTHADLMAGGHLELEMGPLPNKKPGAE